MSVITPSSNVTLLKCPLEMDNNHQLNFASATAQHNYFNGLSKLDIGDDFTYIRQENVIRVEASIDDIMRYNYLMYQNEAYSNKWFYAYIVDMVYLNDNCTAIYFKLDTWQTWQFDLTFKKCFVEREHVNSDHAGEHTIPENLEYGNFVCASKTNEVFASPNDKSVMAVFQVTTCDLSRNGTEYHFPKQTYSMFNGLPQGCLCFAIELNKDNSTAIPTITNLYDACGKGDAIVAITLVPKICTTWIKHEGSGVPLGLTLYTPVGNTASITIGQNIVMSYPNTIDGYTPKNNKLYASPYTYFYVSNNAGEDVTFRFEDFMWGGTTGYSGPTFKLKGSFEQGGSIYCIPQNSKISDGTLNGDGYVEGIKGIVLPNISWTSDYYLNWQAVNGKNIAIQTGLDALNWGGNLLGTMAAGAGGDPHALSGGSGITGLASRVASTAQQIREAKMTPPQARGNVGAGSFAYSDGQTKFTFRVMTIKAEYARIIDNYFTMYGYKVNMLKVPNITGRQNWNYVKTIDVNIVGDVPQDDIQEIKGYFDRGITIWHNPSTFLDYNQNNNIV